MTDEHQHRAAQHIRVELIEADLEIGFGLVDSALGELRIGNLPFARRALEDAEKVLIDIEQRLQELDAEQSRLFGPPIDELRRSVHAVESECDGTA